MNKKKMGGLGKLSQFSGIKQKEETVAATALAESPPAAKPQAKTNESAGEKLATVNIKVTKSQRDWLAETASQVRDNNSEPVPSKERVYPQHLIGVAIDLLRSQDLDWTQVKNVGDLREKLNL